MPGSWQICDDELAIPGGPGVPDRYPQGAPPPRRAGLRGKSGVAMLLSAKSYLPRARMDLNYTLLRPGGVAGPG